MTLSQLQLKKLQDLFPGPQFTTSPDDLKVYGKDWTTYYDINASAVVFPHSAEQVRELVLWARSEKIALIPSGGRTGLSGGACATQGEVVVSFARMQKIISFNEAESTVQVQAGVITEEIQNFAKSKGLLYPVDFAARGSSQIGGNIATNAGGIKVLRYGLTRNWTVGLKVVTGAGEILNLNNALVKNATGLDLRHLFIGSEGILGFIVEATIQLSPQPKALSVMLLASPDLASVMKVFALFQKSFTLTAFEMFSDKALKHVLNKTGLSFPLTETKAPYYIVAEAEELADSEALLTALAKAMEENIVLDGAIAQNETQAKNFWRFREDISESLSSFSPYKNDIAVRVSKVPELIHELDPIFAKAYPTWEVVWFGHVGDGNLHINILRPPDMTKENFVQECRKVDPIVFKAVEKFQGSISAEHGVGLSKKSFLGHTRSPAEIQLMKSVKAVFDPDQIINPGKVI
jgi:FAD/FMN-containing dehydrogenase